MDDGRAKQPLPKVVQNLHYHGFKSAIIPV